MADAAALVERFSKLGLTLGTAESLTAGMISAAVAGVSGASAVLTGGVVCYDARIKHELLGVSPSVAIVSRECACQMAEGARRLLGADVALSATGVAGPTGGTEETPVGTAFIGVSTEHGTRVDECHFEGGRQAVREKCVKHAIEMAMEAVQG